MGQSSTVFEVLRSLWRRQVAVKRYLLLNWECQVRKGSLRIICSEYCESPIFLICPPASRAYSSSIHIRMMALLWVDRERRYFVSTTSTSLDATPYVRERWRQTGQGLLKEIITVRQSQVCETYYNACAGFNLEKKVETHD